MSSSKQDIVMKSGSSKRKDVKKRKLPSLKSLRNKLDQVFSAWIRKRDANENGMGRCITCNRWALLECGHFIPRQHKATRWNPLNAAGQCSYCNRWQHGAQGEFLMALTRKYDQVIVSELMRIGKTTAHFKRNDLSAMIETYSKPPPTDQALSK